MDSGWTLILNLISKYLCISDSFYNLSNLHVNLCLASVKDYLQNSTICVLWQENYEFQPQHTAGDYSSLVSINIDRLAGSFERNVIDAEVKRQQLKELGLNYEDLVLKLTLSIESSHCEVGRQLKGLFLL